MRVIVVKWKRIESQKKELATHNSFEKELKELILQLSTPESLLLYLEETGVGDDGDVCLELEALND